MNHDRATWTQALLTGALHVLIVRIVDLDVKGNIRCSGSGASGDSYPGVREVAFELLVLLQGAGRARS